MKIVFFGNPQFAASSLKHLNNLNDINIDLVVTNPDKKSGRGLSKKMSEVKKTALDLSYKIYECDSLKENDLYNSLKSINADLFIVVAYKYIPQKIYNLPKIGTINLHASLLPKYRGASPIQYALINGDKETGLTTFYINKTIDQGNIISQLSIPINDRITFNELYKSLEELSKDILEDTLKKIASNNDKSSIINNKENEYIAPKIKRDFFKINWNDKSINIHNKIRALSYKGAYGFLGNKRIKFFDTYYSNKSIGIDIGEFIIKDNILLIETGKGHLLSKYIQLEGSKRITALDFINSNIITNKFE